jgi:hypothetical protein
MSIRAIRVSGGNQEYEVHLDSRRGAIPHPDGYSRENVPHVSLRFSIQKFGSKPGRYDAQHRSERFFIPIEPAAFPDVAHAMMMADPQAAIRAFGKAMQEVQISALDADRAA